MKRHISKRDMSFDTYCGRECSEVHLECTPMRESNHSENSFEKIADCKICIKNRLSHVEKEIASLQFESKKRKEK